MKNLTAIIYSSFCSGLLFLSTAWADPASCDPPRQNLFEELVSFLKNTFIPTDDIQLKPELLRPWTGKNRTPCPPPFKATYKKGDHEFTFLAVDHIFHPVIPENSDLKILKEVIEKEKPQGLIVEAKKDSLGPQESLSQISINCTRDGMFQCGEVAYSAEVGAKAGAQVYAGDPIDRVINEQFLQNENNREKLLVYRSAQAVLTLKTKRVPPQEWPTQFAAELAVMGISAGTAPHENWSYSQFSQWVQTHLHSTPERIEPAWITPQNSADATSLQKSAYEVDLVREPLILKVTEEVLNRHKRSMMVFGFGHFEKQAPVYEQLFGPPQIECLKLNTSRNPRGQVRRRAHKAFPEHLRKYHNR